MNGRTLLDNIIKITQWSKTSEEYTKKWQTRRGHSQRNRTPQDSHCNNRLKFWELRCQPLIQMPWILVLIDPAIPNGVRRPEAEPRQQKPLKTQKPSAKKGTVLPATSKAMFPRCAQIRRASPRHWSKYRQQKQRKTVMKKYC